MEKAYLVVITCEKLINVKSDFFFLGRSVEPWIKCCVKASEQNGDSIQEEEEVLAKCLHCNFMITIRVITDNYLLS